ncbi:PREDICTED: Fc receptor-like protein 5 [Chrysochloris asiatica]|uniref:Fc receptor-like protein 5 n=1 Tax=Chrysochloris asiatica TaxID=185453 RepID=A0A9B0TCZ5_CHRAS|nr:PREDICTED: Fc receptor-like protein 5 [Chrysochloris asiatica]
MLLWVSLLVLAPISGKFATAPKSVISLSPPWNTLFQGETVSLTCKGFDSYSPRKIRWYHDTIKKENTSDTIEVHHSGDYRCQIQDLPFSNTVHLDFSTAPLILQAPVFVFQGDTVDLRCLANKGVVLNKLKINKNGKDFFDKSVGQIHQASRKNNGYYICQGFEEPNMLIYSNKVKIEVEELFSTPVLTTRPLRPTERTSVTLICEVQLAPQRSDTQLQFRFFKDTEALSSDWSLSSEFHIPAIRSTGLYSCSVKTVTSNIENQSHKVQIPGAKIPVSQPVLNLRLPGAKAFEGDKVTFYCEVQKGSLPIMFKLYHEDEILTSEISQSRMKYFSLYLTARHSGQYHCSVTNGLGTHHSKAVSLAVKVPVSQPVLIFRSPGTQAFEGDTVTFYCKTQKGSPPIQYQFYCNNIKIRSHPKRYGEASFSLTLTTEHSGNYYCTADNGQGHQFSKVVSLDVTIPVSPPVLTLRTPRAQAVVGDMVELHCESQRGSPPIQYGFYHEDVILEKRSVLSGGGASFSFSLTEKHSGNYHCTADNGRGTQHSYTVLLSAIVPVSRPVLTLRTPKTQVVVGDVVEFHCEVQKGSFPISYQFYHEDVTLGDSSVLSGGRAFFKLSLTAEHSGSYSCKVNNSLGAQLSQVVTVNVKVPVSRPVLTLRASRDQSVVGDEVELHCEAWSGSPPILYRFYHENVILVNSSVSSRGGVSFNLSLTIKHSGNYSCEADNGLEVQHSEVVALSIRGLTGSRSGPIAIGVTGALLSLMGLVAVALLLFLYWLPRKAGKKPASDLTRSPSNLDAQEPTYHNISTWIELQPIYSNVNLKREDVVYSEVQSIKKQKTNAVVSTSGLLKNKDSSVIYSQVKVTSTSASQLQLGAFSAPDR